jgi:hypothetical protein
MIQRAVTYAVCDRKIGQLEQMRTDGYAENNTAPDGEIS